MAKNQNHDRDDIKTAAKIAKRAMPSKSTRKKIYRKTGVAKALPYISVFVGLIMLIGLITTLILQEEAAIFYYMMYGLCGLFGGAAYLLWFLFGFIGVVWCVFDLKWNTKNADEDDVRSANRSATVKTVLSCVFFFLFSTLLGVFDDPTFGIELWETGYDSFIKGGLVGGTFGWLLNLAIPIVPSAIIIILLLVICLCFILGLTPSYIVAKIRCRRELKGQQIEVDDSEREKKYEHMREKEMERAKKKKSHELEVQRKKDFQRFKREQYASEEQNAPAAAAPAPAPAKKTAAKKQQQMTDEEFDEVLDNVDENTGEIFSDPETTPIILDDALSVAQVKEEETFEYGGDPVIDGDTVNLEDLLAEEEPIVAEVPKTPETIKLGEISNEDLAEDLADVLPDEMGETIQEEIVIPYIFPPIDMLAANKNAADTDCQTELQENARILKETLKSFKVEIRDISYSRGPTITRYELKPEVGTRVRSIANLVDDIALSLATSGVRIEAPIPNKPAVGIEVPNRVRATVYLRDLIENTKFTDPKSRLTSCLGMDVGGNPVYFDIGKMPHLLIAGTTGSGKSVCINTIILSILYKARPDEVKLILVDPKQVEFTVYENIPHLYCPIVSEPKKAAGALASAVSEMERRFELIKSVGVRNIESYNEVTANDPDKEYLPKMVIIIDELADLMMTARDEVETSICRLAQKARAAGIHVILGTQRPSVDVITGLIKANVPSRIACTVTSQVDSRTIIDVAGAENLIGYGDMLFAPVGASKPMRVQGAFVSDGEVENIVNFIKDNNGAVKYNAAFIESMEENARNFGNGKKGGSSGGSDMDSAGGDTEGGDSKFHDAVKLAIEEGKISTSLMQRRLGVGYGRAAKIIDTMEQMGYVSKPDGNKPRRVLITMEEYMRRISEGELGEEE